MEALEYLDSLVTTHPELSDWCATLADLYQRKLWDQLTVTLEEFITHNVIQRGDALMQLYHNFITHFDTKINLLKLAHLAIKVSHKYPFEQRQTARRYLKGVIEKIRATGEKRIEEPILYIKIQIAKFYLSQGKIKRCKKLIIEGKITLDSVTGMDSSAYSSYYWFLSTYHKVLEDYDEFYKSCLLYIDYISVESLSDSFKLSLAIDLFHGFLLGDNNYNIGELLAHPIIKCVPGTEEEWLYNILQAFKLGDLVRFEQLTSAYGCDFRRYRVLASNHGRIWNKLMVLCVMEIISSRPPQDRTIPLSIFVEKTGRTIEEVEFSLEKCLSVHLIEGILDQVNGTVHVTWVQPRV